MNKIQIGSIVELKPFPNKQFQVIMIDDSPYDPYCGELIDGGEVCDINTTFWFDRSKVKRIVK